VFHDKAAKALMVLFGKNSAVCRIHRSGQWNDHRLLSRGDIVAWSSEKKQPVKHQRSDSLDQWFLTFFTYFTLLSNKITRFTPS